MFLGVLGRENEIRLVKHIQKLGSVGFAPSRDTVKRLAYQFAEKLNIQHKFSNEQQKAGDHWFRSFLERNPELSIRQSEGLSLARAQGLNRDEVRKFFDLLTSVLIENDLINKPSNIFNMDEMGIQMINKPGKVVAKKGLKDVHVLTSKERGENITVIGCCNAEGMFLPPVLIMKGVNRKPEFSDGLPSGSTIYMNKKSSFINTCLFLRWLKEHFIPRKPQGKTLLVLDGHTSHSADIEILETAEENDVILLCLPSHCTHALQPLDRSCFGPLKCFYNQEAQKWMVNHPNRNLSRYQAGEVIGKAWVRAAVPSNAISGFRATGIYPLDQNAIPDHFFAISDASNAPQRTVVGSETGTPVVDLSVPKTSLRDSGPSSEGHVTAENDNPQPGTSKQPSITPEKHPEDNTNMITPSKFLQDIRPVPQIPLKLSARKQSANILTSPENISKKRKILNEQKVLQNKKGLTKGKGKSLKKGKKTDTGQENTQRNIVKTKIATWSESDEEPLIIRPSDEEKCRCVECFEEYNKTRKPDDWIKCITCNQWLHESCTMYGDTCNPCTRNVLKQRNLN